MSAQQTKDKHFALSRSFAITSLISLLVTALALGGLFRSTAIATIVTIGEEKNIVIAKTALNSIKPPLLDFLQHFSVDNHATEPVSNLRRTLDESVKATMIDTTVVRIKVYNALGTVAYSTKPSQIGMDAKGNAAFVSAMAGDTTSKMVHRGTFNIFDKESEEDNLIQTYIPVYTSAKLEPLGVFEIYTDVTPLVTAIERDSFMIIVGVGLILLLLYSYLRLIVSNADKIITGQQETILARRNALEILSAQLLTADEKERKKISEKLHEGIAQSLVAIKLYIETHCKALEQNTDAACNPDADCTRMSKAVIPELQSVIHDARTMAMELRPPSLDDLGLLATISWICTEFESIYPGIEVEKVFEITESEVPHPLKVVIYRVIQEVLGNVAKHSDASTILIKLGKSADRIEMQIEDNELVFDPQQINYDDTYNKETWKASISERVLLSGGTFNLSSNLQGGTVYQANWGA